MVVVTKPELLHPLTLHFKPMDIVSDAEENNEIMTIFSPEKNGLTKEYSTLLATILNTTYLANLPMMSLTCRAESWQLNRRVDV